MATFLVINSERVVVNKEGNELYSQLSELEVVDSHGGLMQNGLKTPFLVTRPIR